MLRIEEIAGTVDDDFRDMLDTMDDARLSALQADRRALSDLRPVGVSQREAKAMIAVIIERRARECLEAATPPPPLIAKKPRKRRPPVMVAPEPVAPEPVAPAQSEAPPPAAPLVGCRDGDADTGPPEQSHDIAACGEGAEPDAVRPLTAPPADRVGPTTLAAAILLALVALLLLAD